MGTFKETIVEGVNEEVMQYRGVTNGKLQQLKEDIQTLELLDTPLLLALGSTLSHITGTFNDKYEGEDIPACDLTGLMRSSHHGKGFNIGSALAYLKRYLTEGYEKSENPQDLKKAIHYILMELDRASK